MSKHSLVWPVDGRLENPTTGEQLGELLAPTERMKILTIISTPYEVVPNGNVLIYHPDGQVTEWRCPRCGEE